MVSEPVYVGMPSTDRVFEVKPWGNIRCGGPCRDDYDRIAAFQNRGGQIIRLQKAARDSFLAAEKKLGFPIMVTGTLRECAQQFELWKSDPGRFAAPQSTAHTRGLAIDVSQAQSLYRRTRIKWALRNRGWHQSRPDDEPWHYSFGIRV
jgi:hypothetical protein